MKRTLVFIISSILLFTSCDKLILGVSGLDADLQGKWQSMDNDSLFYNFQNNLFQYQFAKKGYLYGYYTLEADTSIYIELLKEYSRSAEGKGPDPDGMLKKLGLEDWDHHYSTTYTPRDDYEVRVDTITRRYYIASPASKKLILSFQGNNYSFRRY